MTSCFQQVASSHFATTLSKQNSPHTMTMHVSFLRRTEVGPAIFTVKDTKLGLRTSTIHITLTQQNREEVVAYITNTNFSTETGVSFPTNFELSPPAPKVVIKRLEQDEDTNWAESHLQPFLEFRKAVQHVRFYFPRLGQPHPSVLDQWMRFASGELFTNKTLGYVVDMFPQILETYRFDGKDPFAADVSRRPNKEDVAKAKKAGEARGPSWYPTVLLNLDVKKDLGEGVEWLFVRCRTKAIRGGRFDLEVLVYDVGGELVAISNHVALAVDASRNLAKRKEGDEGSKL